MLILGALIGGAILGIILTSINAAIRGVVLMFPVAWVTGQVSDFLPYIPDLTWGQSFWVVVLLTLLIPVASTTNSN